MMSAYSCGFCRCSSASIGCRIWGLPCTIGTDRLELRVVAQEVEDPAAAAARRATHVGDAVGEQVQRLRVRAAVAAGRAAGGAPPGAPPPGAGAGAVPPPGSR